MTLAEALRADMAATGESRPQYAARRGIPLATLDSWLYKRMDTPMARMLAEEIEERLGRAGSKE